jgi:hypothetical protein
MEQLDPKMSSNRSGRVNEELYLMLAVRIAAMSNEQNNDTTSLGRTNSR